MITVTISNTTSGRSSGENHNSNEEVKIPDDGKYSIIFLSPDDQEEAEAQLKYLMNSLTLTNKHDKSAGYVESLAMNSNKNVNRTQNQAKPKNDTKKSEEEFSRELNGES